MSTVDLTGTTVTIEGPARVGSVTVPARETSSIVLATPVVHFHYGDAPQLVADHIADPTPHPAYDDMPDLVLAFENQLV